VYVLDTDHLGILQRAADPDFGILSGRIARIAQDQFYVTIVSFHEQILGWNAYIARAKDQQGIVRGYSRLEGILGDFSQAQVLPLDDAAADVFEALRQQRIRIGTMDLRIAAIARSRNMTVLTRKLVDFQRVPDLKVEDWTA
jgi:tRNA(fMet)-specific endonuclease VapC